MKRKIIDVLLAVIRDEQGRYLVAQRPESRDYSGYWEFPGGKREAGEARISALQRECREELGIDVLRARPLFQWCYEYSDRSVRLDAWLVQEYGGKVHGAEGQALRWLFLSEFDQLSFLEANKVMLKVLALPECYAITPEFEQTKDFYVELENLFEQDIRLLQFRAKNLSQTEYETHARQIAARCMENKVIPLLNARPDYVQSIEGAGLHLDSQQLMRIKSRPVAAERCLSASCHNAAELAQAERVDVDVVLLSPVLPTSTHAHGPTLGWTGLAELAKNSCLPVYALGGMTTAHLGQAQFAGCQGIASISSFWPLAER